MAGLHSYNVLDSDEYIQTKKIENRIKTFDLKLRDKQARAAKRAAEAARIEADRNTGNASDVNQSPNLTSNDATAAHPNSMKNVEMTNISNQKI